MNIKVNSHTLEINQNIDINAGEYNITTLNFEFSDEYEGLTKMAVFSNCETSIKIAILNNQCTIPFEVLEEPGQVLLGVYGYEGEDDSLELRYSPEPQYFNVKHGSYQEGGEPTIPPKSEWEQLVEEINQAITETNNLNITVEKESSITTVTLTKKDGTTQTVQIEDGKSLEFKWEGTSLGVRQEGQSEYQYVNLQGPKGEPGAIKFEIVAELPTTDIKEDTIYLVPITPDIQGNNYEEYIYVNGQWELLGKIGVHVDLTDYVKNTDYATTSKAGIVKSTNGFMVDSSSGGGTYLLTKTYGEYTSSSNSLFIGKGTLENVITGKGLVSNTDYANGTTGGVFKISNNYGTNISSSGVLRGITNDYSSYQEKADTFLICKGTLENVLTEKIGDIETILTILDVGSGVNGN